MGSFLWRWVSCCVVCVVCARALREICADCARSSFKLYAKVVRQCCYCEKVFPKGRRLAMQVSVGKVGGGLALRVVEGSVFRMRLQETWLGI